MSKTKILAFSALWAMLFSCGSQDGGPPELKKQMLGPISPFDTLVVEFNSEIIDIDKLDSSNIITDAILLRNKAASKELRFIGKDITPGGFPRFGVVSSKSIIFKKLKNSDGYVKDSTAIYFSTHRILEKEPDEPNDLEEDATYIDTLFLDGNFEVGDGVFFAGIIDKDIGILNGRRVLDLDDYYTLNLKTDDIITITVSGKKAPFKVRFYGPCLSENKTRCNDKTIEVTPQKKEVVLQDTINTGHVSADLHEKVPFYIVVSDNNTDKDSNGKNPSNPYLINVKLK